MYSTMNNVITYLGGNINIDKELMLETCLKICCLIYNHDFVLTAKNKN